MKFPDVEVVKRLFVGKGNPTNVLGVGPTEVRGSAYIEGPQVVGNPLLFKPTPFESGTVMCGPSANTDLKVVPFYSLMVNTFARIKSFLKVDTFLCVRNIKSEIILTKVLQAKVKNFIIDHPTKEGKKLVHSCLEGPENAVYVRGRITDKNIIELPEYWTNLIDYDTITVSLTPIGSEQSLYVKEIKDNAVIIGGHITQFGEMPIDGFYHIFAERIDIDKLQTEID
jgi:hypothetical protein